MHLIAPSVYATTCPSDHVSPYLRADSAHSSGGMSLSDVRSITSACCWRISGWTAGGLPRGKQNSRRGHRQTALHCSASSHPFRGTKIGAEQTYPTLRKVLCTDMTTTPSLPPKTSNRLQSITAQLSGVRTHITPLLKLPVPSTLARLAPMERARLQVALGFAINALFYISMQLNNKLENKGGSRI